MKMKCKASFLSIFSVFFLFAQLLGQVQAGVIDHIYEVSLPVVSQEKQIRNAAFEQGLIEVSVRVSGSSLAPTQLDLSQSARMVRKFRYRAMSDDDIAAYMQRTKTLVPPRFTLWVQFDGAKVKQLLRDNGLPVWGYQRPDVLVWLAVKDGRNRYILKNPDQSQIKDAFTKEAKRRGLPVMWPEYDLQDKQQLKFSDVWGQFWEPVKQASKRYGVDGIILGRMNWSQGSWRVDWSLLMEDKTENWQVSALDLDLLMNSGVGAATDQISSRFAVYADSGTGADLLVRVSDLNSVARYAEASHYLASLAPVKNVFATEVNQYQVDFHIELSGDENDLKRIIALGKVLVPDTRPEKPSPAIESSDPTQLNILPVQSPRKHILRYRIQG